MADAVKLAAFKTDFSVEEMCDWVGDISPDLSKIFKENDIDGQGLIAVVADDGLFKELVPKIVQRAKLKQLIFTEQQISLLEYQDLGGTFSDFVM